MAFLLPVSTREFPGRTKNKYDSTTVHVSRVVKNRPRYTVKKRIKVTYKRPDIEYLSVEYFSLIKDNMCIYYFHCPILKQIVSVDKCLLMCRWKHKGRCNIFLHALWGCLACPSHNHFDSCTLLAKCSHRRIAYRWLSLYYSELLKLKHIVRMLSFGKVKNFRGNGPQLFDSVGHKKHKIIRSSKSLARKIANRRAYSRRKKMLRRLRRTT